MKLFSPPAFPMRGQSVAALREPSGAGRRIETTLRDPQAAVLPFSPIEVPALVLADGTVLTETALLLPFLDTLGGAYALLPRAALAGFGRVLGLLEGVGWNRELRRPPGIAGVIALETARVKRVTDALKPRPWRAPGPCPTHPDAARSPGCALVEAYAERRHRAWPWREGQPH